MMTGNVFVSGTVTMWRGPDRGEHDNATVPNQTSSAVVDGHPAVVEQEQFDWGPNQWLTWHPADGVTVQVGLVANGWQGSLGSERPEQSTVVGVADLVEFANAVRLDTTTACSAPFRMTSVPPQGRLLNCFGSVSMIDPGEENRDGGLLMATGDRLVEVDYNTLAAAPVEEESSAPASPEPGPPSGSSPPPQGPTGGPREPLPTGVTATDPSGRILSTDQTKQRALRPGLNAWVAYQPHGETEAAAIANGLEPAGDPDDPATWPRRPLG